MYRFIALVWPSADLQKEASAKLLANSLSDRENWQSIYGGPGLQVWATGRYGVDYYAVETAGENRQGVILGKLFNRRELEKYQAGDQVPVVPALDSQECERIVNSGGRVLLQNYWGRYVAFLTDRLNCTQTVLQSPGAAVPCFIAELQGVGIYFSRMEDVYSLAPLKFTVNWRHIAAYLRFPNIENASTGLNEVTRLMPGESSTTTCEESQREFLWNPVQIAEEELTAGPQDIARELRRTTMACVAALAESFNGVIHKLSGGFDSTVVLACLEKSASQKNITYLTLFSDRVDSDERHYARLATTAAGAALLEKRAPVPQLNWQAFMALHRTACPTNNHHDLHIAPLEVEISRATGADAIFSGSGGDEVFMNAPVKLSAIDYILRQGVRPGLLEAAMNAAHVSRSSFWSVLKLALRSKWVGLGDYQSYPGGGQPPQLIPRDLWESITCADIRHPLLVNAESLPPGKRLHVEMAQSPHRELGPAAVEPVDPLFSQPLVELCLRTPSYHLICGGRQRGLARMAFADDIAREIVSRESKGSGSGFYSQVFKENRELIRERLLNGRLLRENLFDRHALEKVLNDANPAQLVVDGPRLAGYISLEAWLEKWL